MSGTRIVVLQLRKLIYTAIFVGICVIALIFLIVMLSSDKGGKGKESASVADEGEHQYEAGVYTKEIQIGDATVNLQLSLDEDNVKSVELVNLDESVETMYPLMQPVVESVADQIIAKQSTENISYSEDNQYTSMIVLNAVNNALEKAGVE